MGVAAVIVSDATDVDLVQRALASVLYQTCPVDEIILVEAKRRITNDLEELVKRLGRNIVLEHYHCYNASLARNHGADLCRSEYVCFLDGDDEWSPHMIEDRMALIDDDVCMVTSMYAEMIDLNGTLRKFVPSAPVGTEIHASNIIGCNSYVMLRRDLFLRLGGFDPSLVYHQDWDLWIRMLRHGKVAVSPRLGGIKYFNRFSASRRMDVRMDGWSGFAHKWSYVYRHEHGYAEAIAKSYAEDMSVFKGHTYTIGGPFGIIRRKVLNRFPPWMNLDFCRNILDRHHRSDPWNMDHKGPRMGS